MKSLSIACLSLSLLYASLGWAQTPKLANPGFEESDTKATGWRFSQHAGVKAYVIAVDDEVKAEGKHSFRMQRTEKQVYGLLQQMVELTPGSAGTMRLSAEMRSEKVGKDGWILVVNFLTALGENIISQVRAKPVTGDSDWERIELVAPIPERTGKLSIGVMLLDEGTGWVDDVQLKIEPPTEEQEGEKKKGKEKPAQKPPQAVLF